MDRAAANRQNELFYANRFEIDRWGWNVAMQDSNPNSALRRHMRGFTLPQANAHPRRPNYPAREHWRPVMHAMRSYSTRHGITEAEWNEQMAEEMGVQEFEGANRFLGFFLAAAQWTEHQRSLTRTNTTPSPSLQHILSNASLLRQPIGGIFNLNFGQERAAAGAWLFNRINLSEEAWPRPNHPDNFALLAIGPGGTETTRAEAAQILTALSGTSRAQGTRVVFPETQRVVSFMRFAAAGTLLLHVYAQGDDVDDDEELFERLMTVDPEAPEDEHDWALLNALRDLFVAEEVVMADLAVARAEQPHLARPLMVVTVDWRVVNDEEEEEEESGDEESEGSGSDGEGSEAAGSDGDPRRIGFRAGRRRQ